MSRLAMTNCAGAVLADVEIPDNLLVLNRGTQALKDVLVAYQAGRRAGTASTRGKGQVAGSNRKPWAQKGLGRARAGYRQSPIWRGGGVAFGPHPRSYAQAIPKKMARLAFRRALSEKLADNAVRVLDALTLTEPKTRALAAILKTLKIRFPLLILLDQHDRNVGLAARNLPAIAVALARDVHPYQLIRYPTLLVTRAALTVLENRLKPARPSAAEVAQPGT
jgi:large subunit ribosomal protein L4